MFFWTKDNKASEYSVEDDVVTFKSPSGDVKVDRKMLKEVLTGFTNKQDNATTTEVSTSQVPPSELTTSVVSIPPFDENSIPPEIEKENVIMIVGRHGSGKTTLVNSIIKKLGISINTFVGNDEYNSERLQNIFNDEPRIDRVLVFEDVDKEFYKSPLCNLILTVGRRRNIRCIVTTQNPGDITPDVGYLCDVVILHPSISAEEKNRIKKISTHVAKVDTPASVDTSSKVDVNRQRIIERVKSIPPKPDDFVTGGGRYVTPNQIIELAQKKEEYRRAQLSPTEVKELLEAFSHLIGMSSSDAIRALTNDGMKHYYPCRAGSDVYNDANVIQLVYENYNQPRDSNPSFTSWNNNDKRIVSDLVYHGESLSKLRKLDVHRTLVEIMASGVVKSSVSTGEYTVNTVEWDIFNITPENEINNGLDIKIVKLEINKWYYATNPVAYRVRITYENNKSREINLYCNDIYHRLFNYINDEDYKAKFVKYNGDAVTNYSYKATDNDLLKWREPVVNPLRSARAKLAATYEKYKNNSIAHIGDRGVDDECDQHLRDKLVGKKVEEARVLLPDVKFQLAKDRPDNDVFYHNTINLITDEYGVITHLTVG